ncbi:hypothetical protein JW968_00595 [Candidatus Woesearchaeota archaeon]|nr:hypothetical protein [Candidatus Woesearchaeota archaeon]
MSQGITIQEAISHTDARFDTELKRLFEILKHLQTALHEKGVSSIIHKAMSITLTSIKEISHLTAQEKQEIAQEADGERRQKGELTDLNTIYNLINEAENNNKQAIEIWMDMENIEKSELKKIFDIEKQINAHFSEGILSDPTQLEKKIKEFLEMYGEKGKASMRHDQLIRILTELSTRNKNIALHIEALKEHEKRLEGEDKTRINQYLGLLTKLEDRFNEANKHTKEFNALSRDLNGIQGRIQEIFKEMLDNKDNSSIVNEKINILRELARGAKAFITKMIKFEENLVKYLNENEKLVLELKEKFEQLIHRG